MRTNEEAQEIAAAVDWCATHSARVAWAGDTVMITAGRHHHHVRSTAGFLDAVQQSMAALADDERERPRTAAPRRSDEEAQAVADGIDWCAEQGPRIVWLGDQIAMDVGIVSQRVLAEFGFLGMVRRIKALLHARDREIEARRVTLGHLLEAQALFGPFGGVLMDTLAELDAAEREGDHRASD